MEMRAADPFSPFFPDLRNTVLEGFTAPLAQTGAKNSERVTRSRTSKCTRFVERALGYRGGIEMEFQDRSFSRMRPRSMHTGSDCIKASRSGIGRAGRDFGIGWICAMASPSCSMALSSHSSDGKGSPSKSRDATATAETPAPTPDRRTRRGTRLGRRLAVTVVRGLALCGRFGRARFPLQVGGDVAANHAGVDQLFDAADFGALAARAEGRGNAASARAAGAARSVNKVFGRLRQVVIHDVR